MSAAKTLYTINEASALLGRSHVVVRRMIRSGQFTPTGPRIGRVVALTAADLERLRVLLDADADRLRDRLAPA